jgi:hypothetical protein
MTTQPFDHNGECIHCDELGMHRADCPWLLDLIAEHDRVSAELAELTHLREQQRLATLKTVYPLDKEDKLSEPRS